MFDARIRAGMLKSHEIESLRRSQAIAPLSLSHVNQLLDSCADMARERAAIVEILSSLPDSFGEVRKASTNCSGSSPRAGEPHTVSDAGARNFLAQIITCKVHIGLGAGVNRRTRVTPPVLVVLAAADGRAEQTVRSALACQPRASSHSIRRSGSGLARLAGRNRRPTDGRLA